MTDVGVYKVRRFLTGRDYRFIMLHLRVNGQETVEDSTEKPPHVPTIEFLSWNTHKARQQKR